MVPNAKFKAFKLYLAGVPLRQISGEVSVSVKTLRLWLKDEGCPNQKELVSSTSRATAAFLRLLVEDKLSRLILEDDLTVDAFRDIEALFRVSARLEKTSNDFRFSVLQAFDKFLLFVRFKKLPDDFKLPLSRLVSEFF